MGRIYTVAFENVSIAAAQDFFEVLPAANKPVKLLYLELGGAVSETSEQLRLCIKRLPATVTSGTGGTTPTIQKRVSADATAGFSAEVNNTGRATTSGTAQVLHAVGFNAVPGYAFYPPVGKEFEFINGEALIVGLEANPSGATTMSGTIMVEEA